MNIRKKYIRRFIRGRGELALTLIVCFTVLSLPVAWCFEPISEYFLILAIMDVPVGLWFLLSLLHIPRFHRMIDRQEELYSVRFGELPVVPLFPRDAKRRREEEPWNQLYLSENWFIQPGKLALYRPYITEIRHSELGNGITDHTRLVSFKTVDGHVYRFLLVGLSGISTLRLWLGGEFDIAHRIERQKQQ